MDTSPPSPCDVVPSCPMCGGAMELVYDRPETKECECSICGTRITVPTDAWDSARQFGFGKPWHR
jgi:hypothetical protein